MEVFYQNELTTLYNNDCLKVMDYLIEQGIKVDAIITDPPYGTTDCKWDSVIPFVEMWKRLNKLSFDNTPILLFGSEPFSSQLRCSNLKQFKHDWIWNKKKSGCITIAKFQPMKIYEIISVFSKKTHNYYPIMTKYNNIRKSKASKGGDTVIIKNYDRGITYEYSYKYPQAIITISSQANECNNKRRLHTTQKPVSLLEYLIKTYTKKGDLILDFTCGSGSTLFASDQNSRRSIGIELEKKYCDITVKRLRNMQLKMDI